jgi:hypothetical protein
MKDSVITDFPLRIFVLVVIAGLALTGIVSARGLYADGSFYLFRILKTADFYNYDKPRLFADILTQAPVVLALKAGILDLSILIRIHSFGLIGIPLAIWAAALIVQMKTDLFWFFVISFSASYLCSGFCAVCHCNLAHAMAALSAAILMKDGAITRVEALVLILLSVCSPPFFWGI